jgi:hypothetical protein
VFTRLDGRSPVRRPYNPGMKPVSSVTAATSRRRAAKLLRVLVMGGAALAASCASKSCGGSGEEGTGAAPSGERDGGNDRGGGVRGW